MIWVVGDVHGCVRALEQLLRKVRFERGEDVLWSVGDLVNTGPDSLETLRIWSDLAGRAVLGNHDIYALRAFERNTARRDDTLRDLFRARDAEALLGRLRSMPLFAEPAPGVWLVHAGLHPDWENPGEILENGAPHDDAWLTRDEARFATRVRCCDLSGRRAKHAGPPSDCPKGFAPWDRFYRGDALVVHGHWAMRGYYREGRVLGLDSGCVYGNALTAWCVEEERVVQAR